MGVRITATARNKKSFMGLIIVIQLAVRQKSRCFFLQSKMPETT